MAFFVDLRFSIWLFYCTVLATFLFAPLLVKSQHHEISLNPVNEVNLLWWEPEVEKEPEQAGYHDHFVQLPDQASPVPQTGVKKITHVPASHRSADLYEFLPESRKVVRKAEAGPEPSNYAAAPTHPQMAIIPPFLDFKERPVCMPAVESVNIINTSDYDELHLFAISTDSVHLHSSFFKQSVIPPLGNTTVSIVFLARTIGIVENNLVIQTNVGQMVYQVYGQGIQNPYKVHPFVGAKIPADITYSPPIEIYNPHDEPLHVKEVFTSGGFLHLNLPDSEYPTSLWTIEPHTRKTVINLAFISQQPGKYTGFVNIKTDKDNMILHVDVLVVKGGLHRTPEEVDFATLTTAGEKRTASLLLLNSGSSPVLVSEIYPLNPDPLLFVNFTRTVIPPDTEIEIATFTYSGRTEGQFSGKLLLRTNDTNPANARMEIPYKARVLHGSLGYLPLNTTFSVGLPPFKPVVQSLVFTNKFPLPLTWYAVETDDPHFSVVDFKPGLTVQPGAAWPPMSVRFLANSTDMMYITDLTLLTNVSTLRVPLHCYHGRLFYSVMDAPDASVIDFGVLGVNEIRTRTFNLTNPNPVKVPIYNIETSLDGLVIKLDSVWNSHGYATSGRGEFSKNRRIVASSVGETRPQFSEESPFLVLEPGNSAIFTVELSSTSEELRNGTITVTTPHEKTKIEVQYHSMKGSLTITPPVIRFDQPAFPGCVLKKSIMAKSTYSRPIRISSITSSDARLIPVVTNTTLEPNTRTEIGYVIFDPSRGPLDDNYLAEPSLAAQAGLSRPGEPLTRRDLQAHQRREQVWSRLVAEKQVDIKGSLTVNTDVVMGYTLALRASLTFPTVVPQNIIDFSLTQVGSSVTKMVAITNPSDKPIHVQLLPLTESPDSNSVLPPSDASLYFHLPAEATTGEIVPPHARVMLGPLRFSPLTLAKVNTTLYVKNNLTILDSVLLVGEGGSGRLLFQENGTEISELLFQLDHRHLGHCLNQDSASREPQEIVLLKKFKAINKGNLPVKIESIGINGRKCEGYGFTVQNCETFSLEAGESADLAISFHPDFSSSVVKRDLLVSTSQGMLTFALVATLPYELLPLCVDSQPHGNLEETLKITSKGFMVIIFVILMLFIVKELFPSRDSKMAMLASLEGSKTEQPPHNNTHNNKEGKESKEATKEAKDKDKEGTKGEKHSSKRQSNTAAQGQAATSAKHNPLKVDLSRMIELAAQSKELKTSPSSKETVTGAQTHGSTKEGNSKKSLAKEEKDKEKPSEDKSLKGRKRSGSDPAISSPPFPPRKNGNKGSGNKERQTKGGTSSNGSDVSALSLSGETPVEDPTKELVDGAKKKRPDDKKPDPNENKDASLLTGKPGQLPHHMPSRKKDPLNNSVPSTNGLKPRGPMRKSSEGDNPKSQSLLGKPPLLTRKPKEGEEGNGNALLTGLPLSPPIPFPTHLPIPIPIAIPPLANPNLVPKKQPKIDPRITHPSIPLNATGKGQKFYLRPGLLPTPKGVPPLLILDNNKMDTDKRKKPHNNNKDGSAAGRKQQLPRAWDQKPNLPLNGKATATGKEKTDEKKPPRPVTNLKEGIVPKLEDEGGPTEREAFLLLQQYQQQQQKLREIKAAEREDKKIHRPANDEIFHEMLRPTPIGVAGAPGAPIPPSKGPLSGIVSGIGGMDTEGDTIHHSNLPGGKTAPIGVIGRRKNTTDPAPTTNNPTTIRSNSLPATIGMAVPTTSAGGNLDNTSPISSEGDDEATPNATNPQPIWDRLPGIASESNDYLYSNPSLFPHATAGVGTAGQYPWGPASAHIPITGPNRHAFASDYNGDEEYSSLFSHPALSAMASSSPPMTSPPTLRRPASPSMMSVLPSSGTPPLSNPLASKSIPGRSYTLPPPTTPPPSPPIPIRENSSGHSFFSSFSPPVGQSSIPPFSSSGSRSSYDLFATSMEGSYPFGFGSYYNHSQPATGGTAGDLGSSGRPPLAAVSSYDSFFSSFAPPSLRPVPVPSHSVWNDEVSSNEDDELQMITERKNHPFDDDEEEDEALDFELDHGAASNDHALAGFGFPSHHHHQLDDEGEGFFALRSAAETGDVLFEPLEPDVNETPEEKSDDEAIIDEDPLLLPSTHKIGTALKDEDIDEDDFVEM